MKKFYILFTIFLILICVSSFSWAFESPLELDCTSMGFSTYSIDISNIPNYEDYNYIYISNYNNDILPIILTKTPAFISQTGSNDVVVSATDGLYTFYYQVAYNSYYGASNVSTVIFWTDRPTYSNIDLYTDYTLQNAYTASWYHVETSLVPSSSSGGGSEEEEESNTILDGILHLFVPNSPDWEDLQDEFEEDILSKFHITSMSFNDNLEYEYDFAGLAGPTKSAPTISLGSWGNIDLSAINDLLHTPLSFGMIETRYMDHVSNKTLETEGITMYDVINIVVIIDIFICNIVLYNRFFNKAGD